MHGVILIFLTNSEVMHLKTYPGEKPYQCNQCDKKFTTNSNQKGSMITQIGEKFLWERIIENKHLYSYNNMLKSTQCDKTLSQNGYNFHIQTRNFFNQ